MDRSTIVRDVMSNVGMTKSRLSDLSGVKQPSLAPAPVPGLTVVERVLEVMGSCSRA